MRCVAFLRAVAELRGIATHEPFDPKAVEEASAGKLQVSLLDSALDLRAIESLLGRSTRRTKGTIDQIAGKYFAN